MSLAPSRPLAAAVSPKALAALLLATATLAGVAGCRSSAKPADAPVAQAEELPPPPPVTRELRGVWVATVANIDWPTKPGLSVEQQQAEARAILDRAEAINLNTVILQIRPGADALYNSPIEPWSYFLTGEQGKAPEPFYDPLQFWIEEAHARGMELHAWFNPFRAKPGGARYELSPSHIGRTNPDAVKAYGGTEEWPQLWMDPNDPDAREQTLAVFADVVERYDLDGIHIDDYFYPYPVAKDGKELPFPDEASYERYKAGGGKLPLDEWRRQAINGLVEDIYEQTKQIKPHVKFGISPFGIWRPGNPPSVAGFDQYAKLYADAKLWLNEGWLDYYTPQLYWPIAAPKQSFPALLGWWMTQNTQNRTLAPGLYTSRVEPGLRDWPTDEIVGQVLISRAMTDYAAEAEGDNGGGGHVHFSMKALTRNTKDLAEDLRTKVYTEKAVAPPMTWVDARAPRAPRARLTAVSAEQARQAIADAAPVRGPNPPATRPATRPAAEAPASATTLPAEVFAPMELKPDPEVVGGVRVSLASRGETPRWWAVQALRGNTWTLQLVRGNRRSVVVADYGGAPVRAVAVRALDKAGNASAPVVLPRDAAGE